MGVDGLDLASEKNEVPRIIALGTFGDRGAVISSLK